jgi:hypothetical protein
MTLRVGCFKTLGWKNLGEARGGGAEEHDLKAGICGLAVAIRRYPHITDSINGKPLIYGFRMLPRSGMVFRTFLALS